MIVIKDKRHINAMLRQSLLGGIVSRSVMLDYGYCFTLINGRDKLGYACFLPGFCVVEFSDYDSMLFGEDYGTTSKQEKKNRFISFCRENGIKDSHTDYWLSLLERCAVGEKITMPELSGSLLAKEFLGEVIALRSRIIAGDEIEIFEAMGSLHNTCLAVEQGFPFGYSSKPFLKAWNISMKKKNRFLAYAGFAQYAAGCSEQVRQAIELSNLDEIIEQQTIILTS